MREQKRRMWPGFVWAVGVFIVIIIGTALVLYNAQ